MEEFIIYVRKNSKPAFGTYLLEHKDQFIKIAKFDIRFLDSAAETKLRRENAKIQLPCLRSNTYVVYGDSNIQSYLRSLIEVPKKSCEDFISDSIANYEEEDEENFDSSIKKKVSMYEENRKTINPVIKKTYKPEEAEKIFEAPREREPVDYILDERQPWEINIMTLGND